LIFKRFQCRLKNAPINTLSWFENLRYQSLHGSDILEENKRLGIATPIGIAGRIYFIMPDGKILTEEEYKALTPDSSPKGREESESGASPRGRGEGEERALTQRDRRK